MLVLRSLQLDDSSGLVVENAMPILFNSILLHHRFYKSFHFMFIWQQLQHVSCGRASKFDGILLLLQWTYRTTATNKTLKKEKKNNRTHDHNRRENVIEIKKKNITQQKTGINKAEANLIGTERDENWQNKIHTHKIRNKKHINWTATQPHISYVGFKHLYLQQFYQNGNCIKCNNKNAFYIIQRWFFVRFRLHFFIRFSDTWNIYKVIKISVTIEIHCWEEWKKIIASWEMEALILETLFFFVIQSIFCC